MHLSLFSRVHKVYYPPWECEVMGILSWFHTSFGMALISLMISHFSLPLWSSSRSFIELSVVVLDEFLLKIPRKWPTECFELHREFTSLCSQHVARKYWNLVTIDYYCCWPKELVKRETSFSMLSARRWSTSRSAKKTSSRQTTIDVRNLFRASSISIIICLTNSCLSTVKYVKYVVRTSNTYCVDA